MILGVKKLYEDSRMPAFAHPGDAGADVFSHEDTVIKAGSFGLVKTGVAFETPEGYEIQVRSKSGIALKNGVFVLNSPGTVEYTYKGELGVILCNISNEDFVINKGSKVAQIVVKRTEEVELKETFVLSESVRGTDGFGSTGLE